MGLEGLHLNISGPVLGCKAHMTCGTIYTQSRLQVSVEDQYSQPCMWEGLGQKEWRKRYAEAALLLWTKLLFSASAETSRTRIFSRHSVRIQGDLIQKSAFKVEIN